MKTSRRPTLFLSLDIVPPSTTVRLQSLLLMMLERPIPHTVQERVLRDVLVHRQCQICLLCCVLSLRRGPSKSQLCQPLVLRCGRSRHCHRYDWLLQAFPGITLMSMSCTVHEGALSTPLLSAVTKDARTSTSASLELTSTTVLSDRATAYLTPLPSLLSAIEGAKAGVYHL